MKGVIALGVFALLGGCSSMSTPQQNDPWNRWVCDSNAEVNWRYIDSAKKGSRCSPESERSGVQA